jgi:hypothetical protein
MAQQRTLVTVALAWNAVVALMWIVGGGSDGVVLSAMCAAPPVVLLALLRHPRAFTVVAAVLGLLYASLVVSAFALAVLFAPAAVCILAAALSPWLSSEPAVQRRRRLSYLWVVPVVVLVPAVVLVLVAL